MVIQFADALMRTRVHRDIYVVIQSVSGVAAVQRKKTKTKKHADAGQKVQLIFKNYWAPGIFTHTADCRVFHRVVRDGPNWVQLTGSLLTQTTTLYKHGEQKSISERTTSPNLEVDGLHQETPISGFTLISLAHRRNRRLRWARAH